MILIPALRIASGSQIRTAVAAAAVDGADTMAVPTSPQGCDPWWAPMRRQKPRPQVRVADGDDGVGGGEHQLRTVVDLQLDTCQSLPLAARTKLESADHWPRRMPIDWRARQVDEHRGGQLTAGPRCRLLP